MPFIKEITEPLTRAVKKTILYPLIDLEQRQTRNVRFGD